VQLVAPLFFVGQAQGIAHTVIPIFANCGNRILSQL